MKHLFIFIQFLLASVCLSGQTQVNSMCINQDTNCVCGKEFPERKITNYTLRTGLQPGDTLENKTGGTRFILKTVNSQSSNTYKGLFWFWWEYYNVQILCEYWDLQVTFGERVTYIGGWAFEGCKGLTNILIPDGVEMEISYGAFRDCDNLASVIISDRVTKNSVAIPKDAARHSRQKLSRICLFF